MVPFGIVLIVLAGLFAFGYTRSGKSAAALRGIERRSAGDLAAIAGGVAAELGSGSFTQTVEIVGQIECPDPLVSPLGQRPCVYYDMRVTRRYEEEDWETDNQGRRRRVTRSGSETVSENKERRDFWISDGTGKVLVVGEEATFANLEQSVSRFDPQAEQGATLSFGSFSLSLPGVSAGRRTIGFDYDENIVPVGKRVTVIGQVSDRDGQLALRKGGGRLTVSTESREEQVAGAEKRANFMRIAAAVSGLAGIVLLVIGLVAG